jgi:hypothetical protein
LSTCSCGENNTPKNRCAFIFIRTARLTVTRKGRASESTVYSLKRRPPQRAQNPATLTQEVAAIASAAKKITEMIDTHFPTNKAKFVILRVTVIQVVTKAANHQNSPGVFKKSLSTIQQQKRELGLQWIPSHCDIHGKVKGHQYFASPLTSSNAHGFCCRHQEKSK